MQLVINGRTREVAVPPYQTLLDVLRDALGIFDALGALDEPGRLRAALATL